MVWISRLGSSARQAGRPAEFRRADGLANAWWR